MNKRKKAQLIQWARRLSQGALVALAAFLGLRHQFGSGGSPIDAYCPFGGLESLYSWLTTGKMLPKTGFSNFILLGVLLLITLFSGGIFCGWLCPLGTVQEWLYKLRRKIVPKSINIPVRVDRILRKLKYGVLILVLIMTIRGVALWFENYDPFKVLFHFNFETTTAYIVLGLTIGLSFLIERFWCKYLCPLGALLEPLAKVGLIRVRKTDECVQCNLCLRQCSMGLNEIGAVGCNNCMECVTSCPTAGKSTTVKIGKKKIRRSPVLLPLTGILAGLILIVGSMGAGVWETRTAMSKVAVPAGVVSNGEQYPPVESITGMAYLDEVAKTYNLPAAEILAKAGLDSTQNPHQPVRDITKKAGKEVETIREVVKEMIANRGK